MAHERLGYAERLRSFGRDARLYIASTTVGSFSWGISSVIFNLYLVEAQISEDFIGFFLSVAMFTTASIAILAGLFSDRTSRKRIVLVAGFVSLAAVGVQYVVLDRFLLLLSQVFIGITSAFSQVSWGSYISDLSTDEERAHLFGISSGISLLSLLAGNLVGGFLPDLFQDWFLLPDLLTCYRYTLLLTLVPLALSSVLVLFMTADQPRARALPRPGSSRRFNVRNVTHWGFIGRYALTVTVVGLGAGMIVQFFNIFFSEAYEVPSWLMGMIFGINTTVLAVGSFLSPAIADHLGKVKAVVLTEALSVPFLIMLSIQTPLYLAVTAFVMRNVLMNMGGPVSNAFFMEGLAREERATAIGIVSTGDQFVRGVAANIGGWMLSQRMFREPYMITTALYILSIALFYRFFRGKERELEALRSAKVVYREEEEETEAT